uniref:Uncharacterized protein n=2 Tax=Chromera velia CCMP2878 TaxID=1169474 RepID=A0A0G4FA88_9ALVE|eukprot:Cvel_15854.t1-p1 / transcript=Cvel_15854.t1 / gene=Cvel_15854 / organism=Chromera_velia_CCMP2878 / gene_product=hypothetical protein / transcript_product=hypothetical protein / location=Cvel_scaffold1195:797-13645(-) / protein_length=1080 / sequence_SO=supercontig / SO=protein_coding / is_pseudo=false
MVGHGEDSEIIFASKVAGTVLIFVPDESKLQAEAQKSSESGDHSYLSAELGGKWSFFAANGTRLSQTTVTDLNFMFPPEDALWNLCGEEVPLNLPCTVGDFEPHVEAGIEGAPCTLLGDCDEGLQCVKVSMLHSVCVKSEEVDADAEVVRGPQPAPPWDNCFFAPEDRKCSVEGFVCYRNTQWDSYAQCRPEGDCPKPSLSALRAVEGGASRALPWDHDGAAASPQRPLHTRGTSLQSVHRRLMEADSMRRYQRGRRRRLLQKQKRRRRRLEEGEEGGEREREREENAHKRRLQDCVDRFRKSGQGEGEKEEGISVGSSDFSYQESLPDVRVNAVGRVEVKLCDEWMDFSEVGSENASPFLFAEEDDDGNVGEGGETEDEEEDPDLALTELPTGGEEDVGWTYGWQCDQPLGMGGSSTSTAEGGRPSGVMSKEEAGEIAKVEGLVPQDEDGILFLFERETDENGEVLKASSEENIQQSQMGDSGTSVSDLSFLDPSLSTNLPAQPTLPPRKHRGLSMRCHPEIPIYRGAPARTWSPSLSCAPRLALAPSVNVGTAWYFAPHAVFSIGWNSGPTVYLAPFIRVTPSFNTGFRVFAGPIVRIAPTYTSGVSITMAPFVTGVPSAALGVGVTLAPVLLLPNIFEDFFFQRTDFGPSKRDVGPPVVEVTAKDAKIDPASVLDFVYEDVFPVRETVATVQGIELPNTPKALQKVGIKRHTKLGDFFVAGTTFSVTCPRLVIQSPDQEPGTIKVLYVNPRDSSDPNLLLSEQCITAMPSDVIRDIPNLPPQAIYGIRMLEAIEALIPPELRVAADLILNFARVVGEGGIPDLGSWLKSFSDSFADGGFKGVLERLPEQDHIAIQLRPDGVQRRLKGGGEIDSTRSPSQQWHSRLTFQRAMKIAVENLSPSSLPSLPSLFPPWSSTMKRAKETAESLIKDLRVHLSDPKIPSGTPFKLASPFALPPPSAKKDTQTEQPALFRSSLFTQKSEKVLEEADGEEECSRKDNGENAEGSSCSLDIPEISEEEGEKDGDVGALEALWGLWVSPLSLAVRKLMGALDGGFSGASRLCANICVEPDGMPAGVSL